MGGPGSGRKKGRGRPRKHAKNWKGRKGPGRPRKVGRPKKKSIGRPKKKGKRGRPLGSKNRPNIYDYAY